MSLLIKAAFAAGAAASAYSLADTRRLKVSSYTLELPPLPAAFDGLRILHISDLHAASFGKDQKTLLSTAAALSPDLVLITGDLIDRRRTLTEDGMRPALVLLTALAAKYPTIRTDGNHEVMSPVGERFRELAAKTGAQDITGRTLTVRKGDDALVLLGVEDVAKHDYDESRWRGSLRALCAPAADSFRIALAHRPQYLEDYALMGLPLVLSGHAHGGQVRLPFVGGLYAPEQGVLPRLTAGVCEHGNTRMVISRGLGNSGFPLRFMNTPELVLITLKKELD